MSRCVRVTMLLRISSDVCWAGYLLSDLISSYSRLAKLRGFLVAEAGVAPSLPSAPRPVIRSTSGKSCPCLWRYGMVRCHLRHAPTCSTPVIPQYRAGSLMLRPALSYKVKQVKLYIKGKLFRLLFSNELNDVVIYVSFIVKD